MIAEVFPEAYDAVGRRTARPDLRRKGLRATAPMGRYVSQPLTVKCNSLSEIQEFLLTCKYVSDEAQFHKKDYWQPPDEFEKTKKGDCDCFALWTWREFLALGYDARFGSWPRWALWRRACVGAVCNGWKTLLSRSNNGTNRRLHATPQHTSLPASALSGVGR